MVSAVKNANNTTPLNFLPKTENYVLIVLVIHYISITKIISMKIIRTTDGIRRMDDSNEATVVLKLREILHDQRSMLISRLVTDLSTYIDYKFSRKPDSRQLEVLRERLYAIRNSPLDLERYDEVLQHVLKNDVTHLGAAPFFSEIDEVISRELNGFQLKLV